MSKSINTEAQIDAILESNLSDEEKIAIVKSIRNAVSYYKQGSVLQATAATLACMVEGISIEDGGNLGFRVAVSKAVLDAVERRPRPDIRLELQDNGDRNVCVKWDASPCSVEGVQAAAAKAATQAMKLD